MPEMLVFSEVRTGQDGAQYSVRHLLTRQELAGLQAAGVVGDVFEVVGMQSVADAVVARFELEAVIASGGRVQ